MVGVWLAYSFLALWGWSEIINLDNWGWPFILVSLVYGISLFVLIAFPLLSTVGVYFGAVDVMGWDWWIGLLLALPGVLFVVFGLTGMGVTAIMGKLKGEKH